MKRMLGFFKGIAKTGHIEFRAKSDINIVFIKNLGAENNLWQY